MLLGTTSDRIWDQGALNWPRLVKSCSVLKNRSYFANLTINLGYRITFQKADPCEVMKVQLELGDGRWEMPNLWKGRKEDSRQGINKRNAATCLFKYSYIKCAWHSPVALPRFEPYPSCSRGNIIILNFSYSCELRSRVLYKFSFRCVYYCTVFESVFLSSPWVQSSIDSKNQAVDFVASVV